MGKSYAKTFTSCLSVILWRNWRAMAILTGMLWNVRCGKSLAQLDSGGGLKCASTKTITEVPFIWLLEPIDLRKLGLLWCVGTVLTCAKH